MTEQERKYIKDGANRLITLLNMDAPTDAIVAEIELLHRFIWDKPDGGVNADDLVKPTTERTNENRRSV